MHCWKVYPSHVFVLCFDACNSDFISEFKPKYVIAVSYQVVFKFAWRYSLYFLTDSPHMWITCTLNFVFLWNSVTLNLMLILFLLQYRPFQWVCFPFNFILFSELIGFYHLVHFCWMNFSCTNVKVPLKKSMVKVEVLSFFSFYLGFFLGRKDHRRVQYIRIFFPCLISMWWWGGCYAVYHNLKLFQEKSLRWLLESVYTAHLVVMEWTVTLKNSLNNSHVWGRLILQREQYI